MIILQKLLFYAPDSTEFEKYFFEDKLLDFPKYLALLQTYLQNQEEPSKFIQSYVHTESKDGEKEDVLTVETVFFDHNKFLRLWGVKDLESGTALIVTLELLHPDTKETVVEYTVIKNDEYVFSPPFLNN